ncbi:N-acetylmuramoyl-L-alanine amidase [Sporosarcina jiandibaonis]|uniref:N-acetylmuramoyl-L-alanine amidase n=1 Tax=Sporosarcina jiandibaonis TaxID=2715535 RepID=UPI001555B1C9|nr:N-acetylmuramoyl-L-alanine amidase [Sporosarcina jiandibaonis]
MIKIAIDAGHGFNTPGKRAPSGEREWSFNNEVALSSIAKLNAYQNVQLLRLDDPTGMTDVPLKTRTDRANAWKADVLISIHHNAYLGKWGPHGGIETYTLPGASKQSRDIAALVHPLVVKAMGLRDRGNKTLNLHMLRESKMPAILVEGGFMDSITDINVLLDKQKLKKQGAAIAQGLADYFNLRPKKGGSPHQKVYKYGDIGSAIGTLQKDFNRLGYKLIVDNSFGPAVLAAVKDFQKKHGLAIDGHVGPSTQSKMLEYLGGKDALYRIIINGKQIGTYRNTVNITAEIEKAVNNGEKKIEVQKVYA